MTATERATPFDLQSEIARANADYFADRAIPGVDFVIPDWLRERKPDSDGKRWFYNLRLGIYEREGGQHYDGDPMRADEEEHASKHRGVCNSWSGD